MPIISKAIANDIEQKNGQPKKASLILADLFLFVCVWNIVWSKQKKLN